MLVLANHVLGMYNACALIWLDEIWLSLISYSIIVDREIL